MNNEVIQWVAIIALSMLWLVEFLWRWKRDDELDDARHRLYVWTAGQLGEAHQRISKIEPSATPAASDGEG